MLTDSVKGPKKAVCHKCANGLRFDALCRRARLAALDLSLLLDRAGRDALEKRQRGLPYRRRSVDAVS